MHVPFKIHYRNNLIEKKDSYLIPRPPSWDDRNYGYDHQLYPSEDSYFWAKNFLFSVLKFNFDLILIEHRNKHIVTFFWTTGTHCNFLTSDRHFGCKVVLSANFLKSDTGKNYNKVIPTTTCLFMQKT